MSSSEEIEAECFNFESSDESGDEVEMGEVWGENVRSDIVCYGNGGQFGKKINIKCSRKRKDHKVIHMKKQKIDCTLW